MKRMALAQRIRQLREKHNKTQEQVADAIGISRQAYIRLEKGARDVAFVEIQQIAQYLHIPYSEITDLGETESLSLVALCRKENCSPENLGMFAKVEEILGVLSAQERIYYRVREGKEGTLHG